MIMLPSSTLSNRKGHFDHVTGIFAKLWPTTSRLLSLQHDRFLVFLYTTPAAPDPYLEFHLPICSDLEDERSNPTQEQRALQFRSKLNLRLLRLSSVHFYLLCFTPRAPAGPSFSNVSSTFANVCFLPFSMPFMKLSNASNFFSLKYFFFLAAASA